MEKYVVVPVHFFSFKIDPTKEGLHCTGKGNKHAVAIVVSFCKIAKNHGNVHVPINLMIRVFISAYPNRAA